MEQNSRSFHNPLLSLARQRLRRRAVGASWGDGLTQARERQLPAQRPPGRHREGQAPPHRWRGWHRPRSGQRWGVGWGSVSSFGTPHQTAPPPVDPATGERGASRRAGGGARRGRRRQEGKGVLPSEPERAAALEGGLALARPTALSPSRRRTNNSPKTPAPNPRQPLYDHKGILEAQKSGQIKPTARQGPPAWPGCRSGPGARQRLRWLARNRWAALGTSQRG